MAVNFVVVVVEETEENRTEQLQCDKRNKMLNKLRIQHRIGAAQK
jgi:hypothetical protein